MVIRPTTLANTRGSLNFLTYRAASTKCFGGPWCKALWQITKNAEPRNLNDDPPCADHETDPAKHYRPESRRQAES